MTTGEKIDELTHTLGSHGWVNVIKPALMMLIDGYTNQLITGQRAKGDEGLTDEALKNRVMAFKWVLNWERRKMDLVKELEQAEAMREATIVETGDI